MGQEARKRALEVRCPVTVPREVGSLSRMKDDRTNIIVSQQRRDLVFGDWTSATIFVPRRVLFRGARGLSQPPIDDIESYWSPSEKAQAARMLARSI